MASSSSSSPSAPAVSSHSWKYKVFLSFRGEDTRKTFVDHLYAALSRQGIYTYKDDETLPRGESIGSHLEAAIEESQILVIVFSQNYADSSWCLGELAHIMKSKDTRGNTVLPVFYDVEPSTVRKQTYKYGEACSKHELENMDKVEYWRQALVDASNLSGCVIKHMANGHEAKVVEEIVDTILRMLHPLTLSTNEDLVGIESRMQDLESELKIGSGGVRMIGIWGVGGGGKTTLALSVYREISRKFDGCCFMENIREESSKYGLVKLQKRVLSNVLNQKGIEVNNVGGRWLPNDRLGSIKVLIVLDDVDHINQLKMLVGKHDWFGEGSRIIITTRDKHLLNAHNVNGIYNITLLNNDEAINILHKHAPRDSMPMKDYDQLCEDVVTYAGGLPLALTVLGCFLSDKDINEWRSTLVSLKEIPETDIVEKLKISYDGLKPVEQKLFLDIACFYRGEYKDERTMAMLDACGFHAVRGVKVLIQKALVTISNGRFDMHDLVQEMGHYIVRGKHPNNPEKHSRVWKKEDVLKICAMDATKELDKIEAMTFNCKKYDTIELLPAIVANMKSLRWFHMRGDLASPVPTNFLPVELRCLSLHDISKEQLRNGYKHLPNLKIMELAYLGSLIMTPNFDGVPNLERFSLFRCPKFEKIHPSIGRLEKLIYLSIKECLILKMFPPIGQLKKLETLSISGCPNLFEFLEIQQIQQHNIDNLPHRHLDNSGKEVASDEKSSRNFFVSCWMCGDREVTKSRKNLIDVEQYSLEEPCLPHNMNYHTPVRFFPTCLRKLDLSFCNVGDNIHSAVWESPNLEELILIGNKFTRLDFSVLRLPRLKRLDVILCTDLVELTELPSSIAVVMADNCRSLESFGNISNCKWMWKVSVQGKNKLGPHGGDILLDSMLQGNALENHFISVRLEDQMIPKRFGGSLYKGKTFTMHLPHDWYNYFCGFLICVVTKRIDSINIVIKQEPYKASPSELWHESKESNEALDSKFDETMKYVGYVSFSSLRLLNSLEKKNSFSIETYGDYGENFVGVELVSRKSKVDEDVQETNCSEFWEKENTFTIQPEPDSQSSIKILWQPNYYITKIKMVVKVDVQNEKAKMKVFRKLSSVLGIESIAMDIKEKKLAVIGADFDPVDIIEKVRKYCPAEMVSVGPVNGL